MKQTTDELKKIIADAPEGATHCDNDVSYYKTDYNGMHWGIFKGCWCVCVGCNTMRMPPSMRSLADIKEIVELRERLEDAERYLDSFIECESDQAIACHHCGGSLPSDVDFKEANKALDTLKGRN